MSKILSAAIVARTSGYSVIPIKGDGTKRPPFEWNPYRATLASQAEIADWFKAGRYTGYGIICGPLIRRPDLHLEMLDFDDPDTYTVYLDTAESIGLGPLIARIRDGYEERTPKAGAHLPYLCSESTGNTKLARRPGDDPAFPNKNAKALIETRGDGGYFVAAPSNGRVHENGGAWQLISGGIESIATIAPGERRALWDLARSFDQLPPQESGGPRESTSPDGDRPGDIYRQQHNTVATFTPLVEKHGWRLVYTRDGVGYYRRPGKDRGISATFGHAGTDYFYVFSSSTEFETERGYNPFSVYVLLEHAGDLLAAVDTLAPPFRVTAADLPNGHRADPGDGETTTTDPTFNLTDLGNAERLVHGHGDDLRYCHAFDRWYVWDGLRFEEDRVGAIVYRAKQTVRAIYLEAANAEDRIERKQIAKHAQASEQASRIASMISLARSEPGIPVDTSALDNDPWLLNVANGTLDLKSGRLFSARRSDLITKMAPVAYDKAATCPQFLTFLDQVMGGDLGLITFLQRAIGYSLTGTTIERLILILYGEGKNGKSTLLETIRAVLGDYALRTPTETLLAKREQGIPNDVARLRGMRFVSASEAEEGQRLAEAKIKDLTGGDMISARFMRGEFFDFMPTFKIWLSTNHKPVIRGTDRAIWDRIRLVPFLIRIPPQDQDKHLREKLLSEAPGILAWAVQGCLDWQRSGLTEPPGVTAATEGYRAEMDVIGAFIEDCCETGPNASEAAGVLYASYHKWCEANGERFMTQTMFGKRLTERGFDNALIGKSRTRTWMGIALREVGI
jgi:P4 family phage/plasmid primase-like protien